MSDHWPLDPTDTAAAAVVIACSLAAIYAAGKALVWLARRGLERLVVWLQVQQFKAWRR